jgi:hypothetical protein
MKTPPFLASALDGGEWSASRPWPLYPQGKSPRYALHRRLGGPQSRVIKCYSFVNTIIIIRLDKKVLIIDTCLLLIFLFLGSTILKEPWPSLCRTPTLLCYLTFCLHFFTFRSHNNRFLVFCLNFPPDIRHSVSCLVLFSAEKLLASYPTPYTEEDGLPFVWPPPLNLPATGDTTRRLRSR